MTLTPETRVVLTEALRPPAGFRVDVAVGTTYSLDLTALLAAPLAFAVADELSADAPQDPIRLLDAVRRHADHTTVFCQAGGIHVPAYRRIMTFIEDGVVEVTAPANDGVFHPKVWAMRFVDPSGTARHRVVVLSRNLTFDRSWDTALVLDESPDGTIPAAPAAEFLRTLPHLAVRPLATDRARQVEDLATSLAGVQLAAPDPFTSGELLPLGTGADTPWPFPERAHRLLAISPFLTRGAVRRLATITRERHLVSRTDTLDNLGAAAVDGWTTWVLQPLVENDESPADDAADGPPSSSSLAPDVSPADDDAPHPAPQDAEPESQDAVVDRDGFLERSTGLHAKTFIVDEIGGQSTTVTGSANLTGAGWSRNVEFDAVLRGPTRRCGVAATFQGSKEAPGLVQVLEQHTVPDVPPSTDEEYAAARQLERFHQRLAASRPVLEIAALEEDRVTATLRLELPEDVPGPTTVRLLSLEHARELAGTVEWVLAPENVTPFLVVETSTEHATRRCILTARLRGDVGDRRQNAVLSVLTNRRDVLRYLVFLLGDPSYDALVTELAGGDGAGGTWSTGGPDPQIALFEPLVRAAGRDPEALARVAGLVADLRSLPDADLVPEGFDEVWDAVWQAHEELA